MGHADRGIAGTLAVTLHFILLVGQSRKEKSGNESCISHDMDRSCLGFALTGSVTLDKSFDFSEGQFLHLSHGA